MAQAAAIARQLEDGAALDTTVEDVVEIASHHRAVAELAGFDDE